MTLATRLAIAMILLVAVTVPVGGWLSYRSLEQAMLPRVLQRIEARSRLVASDLQAYIAGARADVLSFRTLASANGMIRARLNGGLDPIDLVSESVWRDRLLSRLVAELERKPAYSQFRLIGIEDGQREIVQDRSGLNGAVRSGGRTAAKGRQAVFHEYDRAGR